MGLMNYKLKTFGIPERTKTEMPMEKAIINEMIGHLQIDIREAEHGIERDKISIEKLKTLL